MQAWHKAFLVITLAILIIAPRIFQLDAFRAPDEDRWIARTAGFTRSLAHGQFDRLLQSPTPGITTHWLGALTVRFEDWQIKKLPIALGQSFLIFLAGYLAWRLWGKWTAALLTLLLALNPHLIAHARVYGTDALMPVFIVISFLSLFLWEKQKSTRYLILSGLTAAAAVLSKLPGVIFIPIIITYTVIPLARGTKGVLRHIATRQPPPHPPYQGGQTSLKYFFQSSLVFCVAFLAGLVILLPSFALAPASIIGDFLEIFRSTGYSDLHTASLWYYPRMLLFISTPLELAAVILIPAALYLRRRSGQGSDTQTKQLLFIIVSATLFFAVMSYGSKKGYRYLLPILTLADVALAIAISWLANKSPWQGGFRGFCVSNKVFLLLITIFTLSLLQVTDIARLHPHIMAYTNPLTRPWFQDERYGWGEGLDLAAAYLNAKPNAASLTAASIYPNEFGHYFRGKTKPAHQHDENVDYVIIYRAMFDRGSDAWETDVVNQYQDKQPEKVISFTGIPFVWIYNTSNP